MRLQVAVESWDFEQNPLKQDQDPFADALLVFHSLKKTSPLNMLFRAKALRTVWGKG